MSVHVNSYRGTKVWLAVGNLSIMLLVTRPSMPAQTRNSRRCPEVGRPYRYGCFGTGAKVDLTRLLGRDRNEIQPRDTVDREVHADPRPHELILRLIAPTVSGERGLGSAMWWEQQAMMVGLQGQTHRLHVLPPEIRASVSPTVPLAGRPRPAVLRIRVTRANSLRHVEHEHGEGDAVAMGNGLIGGEPDRWGVGASALGVLWRSPVWMSSVSIVSRFESGPARVRRSRR